MPRNAIIHDHVDAVMPLIHIVSTLTIFASGEPVDVEAPRRVAAAAQAGRPGVTAAQPRNRLRAICPTWISSVPA